MKEIQAEDHNSQAASSAGGCFLVVLWSDFTKAFTELQLQEADHAPGRHWKPQTHPSTIHWDGLFFFRVDLIAI